MWLNHVSKEINTKKFSTWIAKEDKSILNYIRHEKFYINEFPFHLIKQRGLYFIETNLQELYTNSQKPKYNQKIINKQKYYPSLAYGWSYIENQYINIIIKNQTDLLLSFCVIQLKRDSLTKKIYPINFNNKIIIQRNLYPSKPIKPSTV